MTPLHYLATPYTNYGDGIEFAFREAARIAAALLKADVECYSPIAHSHPLAIYGDLDALDRDFWLRYQESMMARCDALIVAEMKGWKASVGVAHEIAFFTRARKPIYQLDPLTMVLRPALRKSVVTDDRSNSLSQSLESNNPQPPPDTGSFIRKTI